MFGIYTNQRISEEESRMLCQGPDDYNWYCVYVGTIFKDNRFFQVREDIKLPQSEDDNGVVLIFEGGDVVYFKTLDGDATQKEADSILEVCSFLSDTFKRPIKAYVVCPSDANVEIEKIEGEGDITIFFSLLKNDDGEETVERLQSKLNSNEEFTISDSIDHMLLPYMGFKDKEVFQEKFRNYMAVFNEHARQKEGAS